MKLRATFFLIALGASLSLLSSPLLAGFATPAPTYPTGVWPAHVAAADFNGDGHRDLAVTNSNSDTVSILLGVGDGTFGAKVDSATGSRPAGVAAADFNGDGYRDLAVTNFNSGTVSILLGVGDGTFGAKMDFATGGGSWGIAIADFNGDGIPDLAVANTGGSVSILTGNGDGSFNAKTDWAMGDSPYGIEVADFNGDGHADLVVGGFSFGVVYLRLGNGDGSFQTATTFFSFGFFVSSADLNGDGYRDIVGSNQDGWSLSILLGNGDGSFQPQVAYAAGVIPVESVIADFDGDGVLDIAVASLYDGISLLRGNGDGTFQAGVKYALSASFGIAAADFNGDGTADLAITGWDNANVVSILLQEGAPVLSSVGVSGTTQTGTTLSATSNEVATGYWIVVAQGSAAPTVAQVKAGVNYGAVTLAASGNGAMTATVAKSFSVTGLSVATAYDLYLVAEDGSSNLTPTATLVQFTTAAPTDTTPDAFSFTAQTGAALSSVATSNTITVAGINSASAISIVGGEYAVSSDSGTTWSVWSSTVPATVSLNDQIKVRQTASASYSTLTTATLTIGTVSAAFNVTTQAAPADTTPDAFSFTAQTGAALSSVATSNTITVAGINSAANISIAGGTYSINGGAYTAAAGTVNNGATVTVQQTASASYSTLTTATLTIGGVSDGFDVTTGAVAPVNGACGGDHALTLTTTPTNLCATGAPSAVASGTTSYTWSCTGSNGGSDASCSATRNYIVTASVSGGNGTISASQTVAYNATPSFTLTPNAGYISGPVSGTCGGSLSGNSYTTNAVTASCTVVAGFSIVPVDPPVDPSYSCLDLSGMPTGFTILPCILNMGSGDGPGIVSALTVSLANTLALPNFSHQNQSGSGTVVMQYDGGKLAFLPLSVQTGDTRANGIYPVGNGKYVVVTNGTAVTVAPGIINLAELGPLLPGWTVRVDEQGIVSASHDGTTYVVQPGYLVQVVAGGSPSLWMGADGYPHFTDSAGNSQTLYPAFIEPSSLQDYLLMLDGGATLNIQLDGTALIRLFGQNYVLVPDLILGAESADHGAEYWWQDGERRYRMRNRSHFGTSQGFGVR